ncbi:hypothetical protein [Mycolicibacterium sphagni]|nr:hypothetical protein [Mycolicibacterium sphagni]MCV7174847.1 hypothetical protein [Mycolicibacterium sphagni]
MSAKQAASRRDDALSRARIYARCGDDYMARRMRAHAERYARAAGEW